MKHLGTDILWPAGMRVHAERRVRRWASPVMLGCFPTGGPNFSPRHRSWALPGYWAVDLENQEPSLRYPSWPSLHVERAFRRLEDALAFARFLEWCVDGLTDEQLVECARVTDGRLL